MVYGELAHRCPVFREHVPLGCLTDSRSQKQQQQRDANAEGAGPKKKKVTAAQLRVQKGVFKYTLQASSEKHTG